MGGPVTTPARNGGWIRTYNAVRVLAYVALALMTAYVIFGCRSIRKGELPHYSISTVNAVAHTSVSGTIRDADSEVISPNREASGCQTLMFFHIPKTGGESMNDLWWGTGIGKKKSFGWDGYAFFPLRKSNLSVDMQRSYLTETTPWSTSDPQKRHRVIEVHCGNALSFMQARDAITTMREKHEKNGCGLYAFTILRSPLEWVVSLYDDICHRRLKGHRDTCPQKNMTSREEMLTYPHRDGIVSYLMHGWNGWDSPGPVKESDVDEISQSLESYLDLVAFTDEVPLLRHYLTTRFAAPNGALTAEEEMLMKRTSLRNANQMKTVRVSDFTEDELVRLNATIQLDWKLFEALGDKPRPW